MDEHEHDAAEHAVATAVMQAEALIERVMAGVDHRSRESMSDAIEEYMAKHGEPRFRIPCFRCGEAVVDLPLAYPSARGLWSWMPPTYYVARFNNEANSRHCAACGAEFPLINPAGPKSGPADSGDPASNR